MAMESRRKKIKKAIFAARKRREDGGPTGNDTQPGYLQKSYEGIARGIQQLPGAGIGAKGALGAMQAAKTERKLSPLGFYSHGAEAASALPQAKGTPEQMRGMLERAGVKPAELEGFNEAFAGKPSVTREKIAQHFKERMPQIEEKVLGVPHRELSQLWPEFDRMTNKLYDDWGISNAGPIVRGEYNPDFYPKEALPDIEKMAALGKRIGELSGEGHTMTVAPTKFGQYTLPGGENYREVLLKLPRRETTTGDIAQKLFGRNMDELSLEEGRAVSEEMRRLGPSSQTDFTNGHWNDPNVLAHLRMADRTGPNGEKMLHVEEMQSDWGQQGRKRGFAGEKEPDQNTGNWQVIHESDRGPVPYSFRSEQEANDWAKQLRDMGLTARDPIPEIIPGVEKQGTLPSAPYVTSTQGWTDLALKRVLKEAAEGGYDKVVFTPGAEQAARYGLSEQISRLVLEENKDGGQLLRAYSPSGDQVISKSITNPEKELPDLVGKEVSEKLLAQDPLNPKRFNENLQPNDITVVPKENRYQISAPWGWSTHVGKGTVGSEKEAAEYAVNYFNKMAKEANNNLEYQGPVRALEGQELSVGGEGMKSYYDKIVPTQINKLVSKYDKSAKTKLHDIELPTKEGGTTRGHVIEITPKMREAILAGQTAFARGGNVNVKSTPPSIHRALDVSYQRASPHMDAVSLARTLSGRR